MGISSASNWELFEQKKSRQKFWRIFNSQSGDRTHTDWRLCVSLLGATFALNSINIGFAEHQVKQTNTIFCVVYSRLCVFTWAVIELDTLFSFDIRSISVHGYTMKRIQTLVNCVNFQYFSVHCGWCGLILNLSISEPKRIQSCVCRVSFRDFSLFANVFICFHRKQIVDIFGNKTLINCTFLLKGSPTLVRWKNR